MNRLLKAKNPVNANVIGTLKKVSHIQVYKETLQPNGLYSKMIMQVVECWDDTIFLSIEVDGKHHVIDVQLSELIKAITDLSKQESKETENP